MPWTLRIALAFFTLSAFGALLILGAATSGGWDGMGLAIWGMIVGGICCAIGWCFSLVCAATEPKWRRISSILCLATPLLAFAVAHALR